MGMYEYSKNMQVDFSASVVALGLFDGVHKGHKALLASAKNEAKKRNLPLVVFTFYSENKLPKATTRLYSTKIKTELLKRAGADFVICADFDNLVNLNAVDFVNEVLVKSLHAELAVTGLDFRFGKGREGDTKLLSSLMKNKGKECLLVEDEVISGKKISTSLIKELLADGKPNLARELLGEPYFIEGKIIHGDGRGESLGLPTVNISLQSDKSFLKQGVYHTEVEIGKKRYTGLTNIGRCPTFEERDVHSETFILDFSDTVYGKTARIYFIDYLREERKFASKEELTDQIKEDVNTVMKR